MQQMTMDCSKNDSVRYCTILTLLFLFLFGMGESASLCPDGWDVYNQDTPFTCYWKSDSSAHSLEYAQNQCSKMNASLMILQTNKKYQYFIGLANDDIFWVPLKFIDQQPHWIINNETELVTLPEQLNFSRNDIGGNYFGNYYSNNKGFLYRYGTLYPPPRNSYYRYRSGYSKKYICEMPFSCQSGYFGAECDQKCHCHGKTCDPTDSEGRCLFGCQLGWMGSSCSQKMEDAVVKYFCVNSADQGKYAHIMIDTKGVHYENIHAVSTDKKNLPWCNTTEISSDKQVWTIKIYIGSTTDNEIKKGKCAGKITQDGHYEWLIHIQEKDGLVSRNDQLVNVECDFANGDAFTMSGESSIKREKWFRRDDIRRPTEYLDETKEVLDLQVVDPFSGSPVSQNLIGSPVVLKIRYGLAEGNFATGVLPYNCDANAPDGNQTSRLLDMNGCALEGSPVSKFFTNGSKSLITKPFPLFGFDGNKDIEFHCSYILCFGYNDNNCSRDCSNYSRHRRSTRITEYRLGASVEIIPSDKVPVLNVAPEETSYSSAGRGLSKLNYIFLLPLTVIVVASFK